MLTLTAIRNDLTTTFTTSRGRRLYRAWTDEHPIFAAYDTPLDAIDAAQDHHLNADEILNAFLTLSALEPLAQQAIVVAFHPWIATHLTTHRVACHERDDLAATIIAAFINAAVTLSADAPYLWPASVIRHAAENPIRCHYRQLARVATPVGAADELHESDQLRILLPRFCSTSGPELVFNGLIKQLTAKSITLEDATIVARLVTDGTSARQQAARLYMSPRVAQRRVHKVADQLLANAA